MKLLFRNWFRKPAVVDSGDFEVFLAGNPAGRNVLIFTEHVNATYFISFDIPLRKMHVRGEINLAVVSQQHVAAKGADCWEQWAEAFQPDVVVMTRYGQPYGAQILACFRKRGIPVIYHIDDDLLEVPESLGAEIQKRQGAQEVIEARRHLLAHCDLIYASTAYLAALLQSRFPRQRIFHGIYAPYMGDEIKTTTASEHKHPTVGYMGSKGHQQDLELVVPALEQLLNERADLHFEVFGTIRMPKALERFGDRVHSHKVNKSYADFLSILASLNWDIGLAPLADESFNRCKAPTKFIEYTAAGIPIVATDLPVYSDVIPSGGGVLVKNGWYEGITSFLETQDARRDALLVSRAHCREVFASSVLERQLLNVFEKVTA